MNNMPILATAPHQAARRGKAPGPAEASRRRYGLATLRNTIATWRQRMRIRRELEQKARYNPYLIDDIGLTRRQVDAEVAKPFWQR